MKQMELTAEETELVLWILEDYLHTLDREISRADHAEFKKMLKQRREVLTRIVARCST
jgi:hypothetical protein